jgi:nitric oxide reductase activation protein
MVSQEYKKKKKKKINLKDHLKAQKIVSSPCTTEQKEQSWQYHNTQLQTILQRHTNKKQHGSGTETDMKTSGTE